MRWRAGLLVVVALAATGWSSARLERIDHGSKDRELLYLPNGKLLHVMSLGHPTLLADVVYLWAIQHYSNYERGDRFRYLEHVFDRVITTSGNVAAVGTPMLKLLSGR